MTGLQICGVASGAAKVGFDQLFARHRM
jgi:hypothetical protein